MSTILDAANTLATDSYGITALHRCRTAEEAVALIKLGFDVDAKDNGGERPLHRPCAAGRTGVVHALIDAGANVNATDNYGGTPLHDACRNGHYCSTKALIAGGANVDARGSEGWTPLHSASIGNHARVAHFLINSGASIDARNGDNKTPLDLCKTDEMKALFAPKDILTALKALIAEYE